VTGTTTQSSADADGVLTGSTTDNSTDGTNPDPTADDDPTNDSIPTAVVFDETPAIGLSKEVVSVTEVSQNTYEVRFRYIIENFGDIVLNDLEITFDYEDFFDTAHSSWVAGVVDGTLAANSLWDGGNTNVLSAGQSLPSGSSGDVEVIVQLNTRQDDTFSGTADTAGTSPQDATVVDTSTDGINPDPDDNDTPDEDDGSIVSVTYEEPTAGG
jgi:hypothetical protein